MSEPKLLTEAEWAGLLGPTGYQLHGPELRERGLIAPEPVDPDLLEAWKVVGAWALETFGAESSAVAHYSTNKVVEDMNTHLALAGLKRGKELAQPKTLTREMVAEAFKSVFGFHSDYNTDRLHTALMEQMK